METPMARAQKLMDAINVARSPEDVFIAHFFKRAMKAAEAALVKDVLEFYVDADMVDPFPDPVDTIKPHLQPLFSGWRIVMKPRNNWLPESGWWHDDSDDRAPLVYIVRMTRPSTEEDEE